MFSNDCRSFMHLPWSSSHQTWAALLSAGRWPQQSSLKTGWTRFLRWHCSHSLWGRGPLLGRRSRHSRCAGAGWRERNCLKVGKLLFKKNRGFTWPPNGKWEQTDAYLPDDALDDLVHCEGGVGVNGEHFPQRVLILRSFHVSIQQIPNHLQEGWVVIFHLNVH